MICFTYFGFILVLFINNKKNIEMFILYIFILYSLLLFFLVKVENVKKYDNLLAYYVILGGFLVFCDLKSLNNR